MTKRYHQATGHEFNPETLALGLGYDPLLSEGSVKPPVFLTSTFSFASAAEGKHYFELAYGLREPEPGEKAGLIYSRLNNPNIQIFEERIAAWDQTEKGASFASGMAAISTTVLALVNPGETIITTAPVYGGTHYLFEHILPRFGVKIVTVPAGDDAPERMIEAAKTVENVRMLYLETPANPSLIMTDIRKVADVAADLGVGRERAVLTVVDNTFLGPVFQRPAKHGADLVVYSATKFIGGHSDLIAGVVTGSAALIDEIGVMRTILGTMPNPFSGWMLLRSLETVSVRMRRQAKSAAQLARLLEHHPKVKRVNFPGLLKAGEHQYDIFSRQCTGPGGLIAFEVEGGEEAAFKVLDSFEIFRLAVSLGGTESLAEHPMSMTHADVAPAELERFGVSAGLIRISVGLEHISDLRRDLKCALGTC